MKKPTFDHDRPLSWSAISSFEWDKEEWYRKYVLGIKDPPNAEMIFGSRVGAKLASDPDFLPAVPRLSCYEFPFKCDYNGIPLIGYADSFDDLTCRALYEYKTGVKIWDQKRADSHGQIDMYLLQNYKMHGIRPEEVDAAIVWIPTKRIEDGDFKIRIVFDDSKIITLFRTKRTMVDILRFGARINKTYGEMEEYCENRII